MTRPPAPAARPRSGPSRAGSAVCGLVLALAHTATAYCVLLAYVVTPDGPWDRQAATGAQAAAAVGLGLAVVAGLLTLLFVAARWLRRWWFVLPALLGLAAAGRLVFPPQL